LPICAAQCSPTGTRRGSCAVGPRLPTDLRRGRRRATTGEAVGGHARGHRRPRSCRRGLTAEAAGRSPPARRALGAGHAFAAEHRPGRGAPGGGDALAAQHRVGRPAPGGGDALAPDHVAAGGERVGHGAFPPYHVAARRLAGGRRPLWPQAGYGAADVAQAPLGAADQRALERIARYEGARGRGPSPRPAAPRQLLLAAPRQLLLAALRFLDAPADLGERELRFVGAGTRRGRPRALALRTTLAGPLRPPSLATLASPAEERHHDEDDEEQDAEDRVEVHGLRRRPLVRPPRG